MHRRVRKPVGRPGIESGPQGPPGSLPAETNVRQCRLPTCPPHIPLTYVNGRGMMAHGKLYSPDGKDWYVVPNTPSDRRALLNLRAWLRRHGFVQERGKGKR